MSILRRVVLPCGIAGGIWGVLAPALVLVPITARVTTSPITGEQGEKEMVNLLEMGMGETSSAHLGFHHLDGHVETSSNSAKEEET